MSEKILTFAQEQQKTKPKIEDVIGELLEGDRLKNASDFIAYLRENKMNPRWFAQNCWNINYKGKFFCSIRIHGIKQDGIRYGLEPGSWHFGRNWYNGFNLPDDLSGEFEDSLSYDEFKEFIWANVTPCKSNMGCMNGRPCSRSEIHLGKEFDGVCGLRIENPDAEALEHTKKLIEYCKNVIESTRSDKS